MTYKTGESMEEYLGRIRPVAKRIGYDNALTLDQFKDGLPHEIKMDVAMSQPNNIQEAVDSAQRFVDLQVHKASAVSFARTAQDELVTDAINKLTEMIDNMSFCREQSSNPLSEHRSPWPPRWRDTRICHYCSFEGHLVRDCRKLHRDKPKELYKILTDLH